MIATETFASASPWSDLLPAAPLSGAPRFSRLEGLKNGSESAAKSRSWLWTYCAMDGGSPTWTRSSPITIPRLSVTPHAVNALKYGTRSGPLGYGAPQEQRSLKHGAWSDLHSKIKL